MDLLTDFASFLIAHNIGTGIGEDIFIDYSPDNPMNQIAIYEYSGSPAPLQEMNLIHRSMQITVRGDNPRKSKEIAWNIYKAIRTPDRYVQITQDRFAQIYPKQSPCKLYVDGRNRSVYGFNIGITTKPD